MVNKAEYRTRGALAREAGITAEAVRFYERRGLLKAPARNESGYRIYDDEALRRIRFIHRARELGFSLQEINELLQLRIRPSTNCGRVRASAQEKLSEIEKKIKDLNRMKRSLGKLVSACAQGSATSECPILDSMDGK